MLSDQFIARLRTLVPMGVGVLATWLATRFGIVFDEQASTGLTTFVTGVVSAVYYLVIKWAEKHFPQAGWLLGYAKTPVYVDPSATVRVDGVLRTPGPGRPPLV